MPIFDDSVVQPQPKEDIVRAFGPAFKTAVVDTRYTPQSDLIAYIQGSTWVVDYYSQILDKNDELKGQDTSLSAPQQQYRRIWSMELKVTQDLRQISQDETTAEFTKGGEANVYPFLVPQVGDMFRVGVADGREGMFKVTKVQRMQDFTDAVHHIEYQQIAANDPLRIQDIENKVVVTYYFVKDFLINLQNPLLIKSDFEASKKLEVYYYDLIKLYMYRFHSREFMTLVVPAQEFATYDHGLVDFVKCVAASTDDVHVQAIRQLNISDDAAMMSPSLWTMLMDRDDKLLDFIWRKSGLVGRLSFHASGLMAGMRYTGITYVVYPYQKNPNVDYTMGKIAERTMSPLQVKSNMIVPPVVPPTDPETTVDLPLIKPVNMDDAYVLSSAFYDRVTTEGSLLEKLLLDYIDFKLIDARDILKLCVDSKRWAPVESFYYVPLLLLLIRYNLRRL